MAKGGITNFKKSPEIVVGLYLIYYIFWHTKKLNSEFAEDGKMKCLYGDVLDIERGRFTRIKYGDDFRYSNAERERLEERFNIKFSDIALEMANGQLAGTKTQWRAYFFEKAEGTKKFKKQEQDSNEEGQKNLEEQRRKSEQKQKISEERQKKLEEQKKKLEQDAKTVQSNLDKIMEKLEKGKYSEPNTIYKIYYYLVHGERYEEKSHLELAMEALEKVRMGDWVNGWRKQENREMLKEYRDKLKKHYEFIQALIYIYEAFEDEM